MDNVIVLSSDDDDDDRKIASPDFVQTRKVSIESDDGAGFFDYAKAGTNGYDSFSPNHLGEEKTSSSLPSASSGESSFLLNFMSSINGKTSRTHRPVHELSDSEPSDDDHYRNNNKKNSPSSSDELPHVNLQFGVTKQSERVQQRSRKADNGRSPAGKEDKRLKREEQKIQKQMLLEEKKRQQEAVREERELKKKEAAHAKALKQASVEIERSRKPGECQKWVTTIVDPGLLNADFSGEMLTALRAAEIDYKIEECVIPCAITWERKVLSLLDDSTLVQKTSTVQKEKNILIVWMWDKIINLINDNLLKATVGELISIFPGCEITIAIYGLEDYFRFQKTQKRRDVRSEILGTGSTKRKTKEANYDSAPQVSRGDLEFALAEIQVKWNVCHRCFNNRTDLSNLVCQFTKAIAEAPFKREKTKIDADRLGWYALGDSQDCVALDKDGNGSLQLWQRQLCQFPLATRETSEAIASVYPSPLSLLKAYDRCSSEEEAQHLLQDISVRRGPGPLSSVRRIGPQLSRKIHTFFTTIDEDCLIAPE